MEHDKILKLIFCVSHDTPEHKSTIFDGGNMFRPKDVLIKNNLNEEYFDLFSASAGLYQSLYSSLVLMEGISQRLDAFPSPGNAEISESIAYQTKVAIAAMRIATHGAHQVMKETQAEIAVWKNKN